MTRVSNSSGGAAAAGGFDFQAKLGAIASVRTLRGTPVQWTEGLTAAAPCAVSFETSGPGDDLSLELADGGIVEIQAKKGLSADARFWSALDDLCEGVHEGRCNYGILIVCPNSSKTVRRGYAHALKRIGEGLNDSDSLEQRKLATRLVERGYAPEEVCAHIRIRTVSALEDAGDAIAAARAELSLVCADDSQVTPAWHSLCQDSFLAISTKGRRTVHSLLARLRACEVDIEGTVKDSPVAISERLLRWTMSRTEHFEALGISRPLPTDGAWLALTAVVREGPIEQAPSIEKALADYHALGEKSRTNAHVVDARTIGTFRKLCVVIGGPGSGKSLLLSVLAREFAKDSFVSIRVRLRDLATRMQKTGCGVEEGLLQLGLDGTGVSREQLRAASFPDLVLLCDGLDECGERQTDIASGLQSISVSRSSFRIVVTTRPIGYSTNELHDWRHYEIVPLAEADTAEHLETLCRCALGEDNAELKVERLQCIHSYLEDEGASRVLARSPLLLAFGAALFLNWSNPGKTKPELYQRIFRLIDDAHTGRKTGGNFPAKAIRNSVLNQMGWLIATSPLSAAEELEKQCARTMERTLGVTYLQALVEVEGSIKYWEEKGLIERLRHQGTDLIAFIHKTCGEFAAAMHLAEMELDEVRQTIPSVVSKLDWDEILDFATETPLATILANLLVAEFKAGDRNEATLNHLIRVLVRPEVSLSLTERRCFLERAFALARSEDRQKAYRIGLCLTEHDLSRMPEAEQMAASLMVAQAEWSRLVGWAVLVCHFPASVKRSTLEDALAHFMECSSTKEYFARQKLKLSFSTQPASYRAVLEYFVLGALKSLLPHQDAEYQDRLVADVWNNSRAHATMRFVSRFSALLHELDREDALSPRFRRPKFFEAYNFSIPDTFNAGYAAILTKIVPSAFLQDDAGPAPRTGLKCLAALIGLAGIKDTPAYDVYVWQSGDTRLDSVRELLRAAAYVYELPTERLAAEARQAIAIGESLHQDKKMLTNLDVFPDVDFDDVEWSRARELDIDMGVIEGLVHHPSRWVQHLAANFINNQLHGDARRNSCKRMLEAGTGYTLYWAAELAAGLPNGCDLLLHRLDGPETAGLHHLFDCLKKNCWSMRPSHLAVLENGLVNCGPYTAKSAAEWCEDTASSADTWLVDLLRSATSYWLENEEPYPESGGIIPISPRAALLRTLFSIAPPTLEELVKLARDPRSDVKDAAIDQVIGLAESSSGEKTRLVESILAKQFSPSQCEKLVNSSLSYGCEELSVLCGLCKDQDPAYRLVGVRQVLTHQGMDSEKALAAANSMKVDDNGSVRDAVHQFLDRTGDRGR